MGSADHLPNSTHPPFKIFIGYDPREDAAFEVCRHSLLKHSSIPLEVSPIIQSDLRAAGLYWRDRDPTESTEFSFTRFLTPYLSGFHGWAMFIDCDFLYTADIADLVAILDDRYAVMCVHHEYAPKETTKMDGAVQTVYPRKNWSSMVLYNCEHPKNRILTPELVSKQSGAFLHRFLWLEDDEIGSVPFVWNFLVGHNRVDENDPSTFPKALHYTSGGPWFEKYKDCEFADLWLKGLEEMTEKKARGTDGLMLTKGLFEAAVAYPASIDKQFILIICLGAADPDKLFGCLICESGKQLILDKQSFCPYLR